jgi:putative transposase
VFRFRGDKLSPPLYQRATAGRHNQLIVKPEHLKQLINAKRQWSDPLRPDDTKRGFKGWYASNDLPHFDAPGTQQFVTYRLADAMPAARRSEWKAFLALEDDLEKQRKIEKYLDKGYGRCHLRNPRIADLVQENLWHHDGVKYRLLAWVLMPNHLHALIETWNVPLGEIVKGWKSYTAKQALKILRGGDSLSLQTPNLNLNQKSSRLQTFWEEDYFDSYVRDDDHYRRIVHYIENNPNKAGLVKVSVDWPWSSARYRGKPGTVVPVLTHPTAERNQPRT